jgi:putative restriction endonuclease
MTRKRRLGIANRYTPLPQPAPPGVPGAYRGAASNHVQNGLALRADLHRLFDVGYVTVTPGYRFEVSRRLKEDFENGEPYYLLSGAELTLPPDPVKRPSQHALEWHATNVFR